MTERPILMSGPLVREILAGRKDVTRRPVKPQPPANAEEVFAWFEPAIPPETKASEGCYYRDADGLLFLTRCPYYADRLWVRESFRRFPNGAVVYRASLPDGALDCHFTPWKPGIHLPRSACRIVLDVVSIRVERLHEITNEDARREGLEDVTAFALKWSEIYGNGDHDWNVNPWVWRIEFRRVERATEAA